jgi:hypothetical protein
MIRLRDVDLKINPAKCQWIRLKIKLLGFVVSGTGVKLDPEKLAAIKDRVPPRDVKGIQTWLGICNYYRRHVKDFAKKAAPLTELLRKESIFVWGKEQQEAFEALRDALLQEPILRHPDFTKQFILNTDASGFALGAVLAQICDDGLEYVVAYASRMLKNAELNYGITEKECLGVVWAIRHFRIYVFGTRFQVVTDHVALLWLMSISEPTGRLAKEPVKRPPAPPPPPGEPGSGA